MAINIVQKGNGEKIIDLTTASLSLSDTGKILTGESAFGKDGNLIVGTMPNYQLYDQLYKTSKRAIVTLNQDQDEIPLPACNIDQQIKMIIICCAGNLNTVTRNTNGTSTRYITFLSYSREKKLNTTTSNWTPYWIGLGQALSYNSSKVASLNNQFAGTDSGWSIVNENQISTGGATVKCSSAGFYGYFIKNQAYSILVCG